MTDEKKPENDEVSDEELEEVAGGTLASLADQAAQETALADTKTAAPAVDATREVTQDLLDAISDIVDIQKTTTDSTLR